MRASSSDVAAVQTTEVSSVTGDEEEEEEESVEGDDEGAVEGPVNNHAHEEENELVVPDMSDEPYAALTCSRNVSRLRAEMTRQRNVSKMS